MANNIVQSFIAASTITEFALVSIDGNGKVAVTTAATDKACIGVAQRGASAGEPVDVIISGVSRIIAGGSITFTASLVMASTAGTVVTHIDPQPFHQNRSSKQPQAYPSHYHFFERSHQHL